MALSFIDPTRGVIIQPVPVPPTWSTSGRPVAAVPITPAPLPFTPIQAAPVAAVSASHLALFKAIPGIRTLNRDQYISQQKHAHAAVANALGVYGSSVSYPSELETKSIFDEIHLLVQENSMDKVDYETWVTTIAKRLKSQATVKDESRNFAYFESNGFQVKVTVLKLSSLEFSVHYQGYDGIISNIMPKVADVLGFDFSSSGLSINVKDGDKVISKIALSGQFYDALGIMGYESYSFGHRFRREEDIYKFFSNGTYFNREMFLAKYPTVEPGDSAMAAFVRHLSAPEYRNRYTPSTGQETPWLTYLKKFKPSIIEEYTAIKEIYKIKSMVDEKFNPKIIGEITGYVDFELAQFMDTYKHNSFASVDDFQRFILTSLPNTIANSVKYTMEYLKAAPVVPAAKDKKSKTKTKVTEQLAPPLIAMPRSGNFITSSSVIEGFTFNASLPAYMSTQPTVVVGPMTTAIENMINLGTVAIANAEL